MNKKYFRFLVLVGVSIFVYLRFDKSDWIRVDCGYVDRSSWDRLIYGLD